MLGEFFKKKTQMASLLICVHKIQESNTSRPLMEIRTSGGKKKVKVCLF